MKEFEKLDNIEEIEKENLAVHVELGIARHLSYEQQLAEYDEEIRKIKNELQEEKKFMAKVITIAVAVLSSFATIAVIALDKLR